MIPQGTFENQNGNASEKYSYKEKWGAGLKPELKERGTVEIIKSRGETWDYLVRMSYL